MMKWAGKHIKFMIDTSGNSTKVNMGRKGLIKSLKRILRASCKSCQLMCFSESDHFGRSDRNLVDENQNDLQVFSFN